jgi:hypothetical protein
MTTFIACSCRASDTDLLAILAEILKSEGGTAWCFVEGPTRSGFIEPAQEVHHANQLAGLWQVRLFAEEFEIAARRCDFQDAQSWMVRWIAPAPPEGHGWSKPVNLPPGKSQNLLLYGQATAEGRFREGRFLHATLQYSGNGWKEGDQAVLVTETHPLDDSAIMRWKRIAKYA